MRTASAAFCAAGVALWAAAPPPAEARSPVAIEGVDREQREAILDLLPERDHPATLFDAERLAEEAAGRARAWLRAEGYYDAEVDPDAQEDPPLARLRITPGARYKLVAPTLVFDGDPPDPVSAAAAHAAVNLLAAGAPARAADVLQAEANAIAALQNVGYAEAAAGQRRAVVDHAAGTLATEFHISAGARATLGALHAQPAGLFRQGFLNRIRNWRPGDTYSPEHLARLRRDLSATGAVSRVSTTLAPPDADGRRDVMLDVDPAKRNAYEFGAGYSTTEGVGVDAQWTRRNFSGRADALTVSTTLGEKLQSATLGLQLPHAAGLERTRRYSATIAHEDTEAYVRSGVAIAAGVDADHRLRTGISYGVELSADTYNDVSGDVRNAYVLSGLVDLRRDTTGMPLDARHGSIVDLRFEPSVSAGDATLGFARFTGEGRLYRSFGGNERFTLATRALVGWVEPAFGSANDIPPDRRYYAGGGGSVRGYEYNSIYPRERDALGLTPGGQGALEVSMEARQRFGDRFGVVAFADGGNAFDDWAKASALRWGAGVGVRYDLGFAPLRVDLATPLDPEPGDPHFAIYISLGQAF